MESYMVATVFVLMVFTPAFVGTRSSIERRARRPEGDDWPLPQSEFGLRSVTVQKKTRFSRSMEPTALRLADYGPMAAAEISMMAAETTPLKQVEEADAMPAAHWTAQAESRPEAELRSEAEPEGYAQMSLPLPELAAAPAAEMPVAEMPALAGKRCRVDTSRFVASLLSPGESAPHDAAAYPEYSYATAAGAACAGQSANLFATDPMPGGRVTETAAADAAEHARLETVAYGEPEPLYVRRSLYAQPAQTPHYPVPQYLYGREPFYPQPQYAQPGYFPARGHAQHFGQPQTYGPPQPYPHFSSERGYAAKPSVNAYGWYPPPPVGYPYAYPSSPYGPSSHSGHSMDSYAMAYGYMPPMQYRAYSPTPYGYGATAAPAPDFRQAIYQAVQPAAEQTVAAASEPDDLVDQEPTAANGRESAYPKSAPRWEHRSTFPAYRASSARL